MVGSMPYNRERKQLINGKIRKQEDDAGGRERLRSAKLLIKGQTEFAPIYRFQLDDLAYNKSNGRIKAEIIEQKCSEEDISI